MNATALLDGRLGELPDGAEFTTRGRTITEGDLTSFSALTGDWHPQHSDAEWAAHSRFSGRVAHGMLVLSYAVGLMPLDPERVVALRGLESATFKRPVAIGDTIRVKCRVESTRPLDEENSLVTLALRVVNQSGRTVALARVQTVCRSADGLPEEEPIPAAEAASRPGADGAGAWAEDVLRLYGGEAFL
ncbi:MAG: MaoC/PaaZ C-terminal domain-containing protein [Solirubrobacterales bacterium]